MAKKLTEVQEAKRSKKAIELQLSVEKKISQGLEEDKVRLRRKYKTQLNRAEKLQIKATKRAKTILELTKELKQRKENHEATEQICREYKDDNEFLRNRLKVMVSERDKTILEQGKEITKLKEAFKTSKAFAKVMLDNEITERQVDVTWQVGDVQATWHNVNDLVAEGEMVYGKAKETEGDDFRNAVKGDSL